MARDYGRFPHEVAQLTLTEINGMAVYSQIVSLEDEKRWAEQAPPPVDEDVKDARQRMKEKQARRMSSGRHTR